MLFEQIAFDHELSRGIETYNDKVGRWWHGQSINASHRYAYRNIADFIRASYSRPPGLIVDYACGAGNLMSRLRRRFPESRLIGVDGSAFLLGLARTRLARQGRSALSRTTLIESTLPNFELGGVAADLVVFVFPNIVPCSRGENGNSWARRLSRRDLEMARALARLRDPENGRDREEQAATFASLLKDRLVSRNMRGILKRGGICIRAEYGNAPRDEFPRLELLRTEFEEGSLCHEVDGRTSDQWFRVMASRYFRSGVMEDVYHQSKDESDRTGGYFITVLKAL